MMGLIKALLTAVIHSKFKQSGKRSVKVRVFPLSSSRCSWRGDIAPLIHKQSTVRTEQVDFGHSPYTIAKREDCTN